MKTCWVIYDRTDIESNRFFADKLVEYGRELGMETLIVTEPMEDHPDLAINRSRDPAISMMLERSGTIVVNNSETTGVCNDKASTYRLADKLGIPRLESGTPADLPAGPPWVVKSRSGHGGTEVYLTDDPMEVLDISDRMDDPLVQSVAKDLGRDMRIYMLGTKVQAAVMRSNDKDFRANFKLGGRAELCEPSDDMVDYARMICEELDSDLVGVDFVFSDGEPYLNEVEDAVGTRMLYSLTDLDLARILMERAYSKISL